MYDVTQLVGNRMPASAGEIALAIGSQFVEAMLVKGFRVAAKSVLIWSGGLTAGKQLATACARMGIPNTGGGTAIRLRSSIACRRTTHENIGQAKAACRRKAGTRLPYS